MLFRSTSNFDELLEKELIDKKFKKEYEQLEKEFFLAKEVIQLRKEQNLTQAELARKVGTSQPAIARLESGEYRNLSLAFVRKVAKALQAIPEIHLRKIP